MNPKSLFIPSICGREVAIAAGVGSGDVVAAFDADAEQARQAEINAAAEIEGGGGATGYAVRCMNRRQTNLGWLRPIRGGASRSARIFDP